LRRRISSPTEMCLRLQKDLARAQSAINELQQVIDTVRSNAAKHHTRLKVFQDRIAQLGGPPGDKNVLWHDLCQEAEGILDLTFQLTSEITTAEEKIRYQRNYLMNFSELQSDPLTGLANRRALVHVVGTQFSMLKRYGTPFSLAIIDIDHFKELNDKHGHLHGDEILRNLTEILRNTSRDVDFLFRYGGDELLAVMPQTDAEGAATLGERLRSAVEKELSCTVSVGVASADKNDSPESLFKRADTALYRAKTAGRNRTCSDADKPNESVLQDVLMETSY
jgi:diguanylate cyclase